MKNYESEMEIFLINQGISPQHLKKIKCSMVGTAAEYFHYYLHEKEEQNLLVPLDKVKGLSHSRGIPGFSWWDHLIQKEGNLSYLRINHLYRSLQEQGLQEFRQSFSEVTYKIKLHYYMEQDEYYVSIDGNHRALWAKIVDAPYICADVSFYKLCSTRYGNYKAIQHIEKQFFYLVRQCQFDLVDRFVQYKKCPVLYHDPPRISCGNQKALQELCEYYNQSNNTVHKLLNIHMKLSKVPSTIIRMKLVSWLKKFTSNNYYETIYMLYKTGWSIEASKAKRLQEFINVCG